MKKCNLNDIIGQKFGRLTVVDRAEDYMSPSGMKATRYKCICDCQLNKPEHEKEYKIVSRSNLKYGSIKSCGCLKTPRNNYNLTGNHGIGYTYNQDSYGKNEFYFDLEDYDKIKDYCWYFDKDGYVVSSRNRKGIKMHRLILNVIDTTVEVDHIIQERKFDNRKSNLRLCTPSQNKRNKGLQKNNTSGVAGVFFVTSNGKWAARIKHNKKIIHLGYFDIFEDAVKVRKEAEEKYFGEFSYDNSQTMLTIAD